MAKERERGSGVPFMVLQRSNLRNALEALNFRVIKRCWWRRRLIIAVLSLPLDSSYQFELPISVTDGQVVIRRTSRSVKGYH